MTVFTIVTDATNDIALPFKTVNGDRFVLLAGEESVTPAVAIIVPTMVPPPA